MAYSWDTVVCSMTWPLNGSEAGCDLVLIKTSLFLLMCKSSCSYADQWHLHIKKSRLVCIKARLAWLKCGSRVIVNGKDKDETEG